MAHEILISDVIGGTLYGMDVGVTAAQIQRQLQAAGDEDVLIRINSPGGSVFEAAAIFNMLKDRGVDISIDGVAASAATVIAMAGRKVRMAENAMFMIHNPWGMVMGESVEMRKTADVLDKVKETIIDTYHSRSNLGKKALAKAMDEEGWFTAKAALEAGFIDEIAEAARIEMRFDLEQFGFKNKPKDWPPPPPTPEHTRDQRLQQLEASIAAMKV